MYSNRMDDLELRMYEDELLYERLCEEREERERLDDDDWHREEDERDVGGMMRAS